MTAVSDLDGSAEPKTEDMLSAHQTVCIQTIIREDRMLEAHDFRSSKSLRRQKATHRFAIDTKAPSFNNGPLKSFDCQQTFSSTL
ncbi:MULTISPECIES: hypothetical protein [unclassified Rhizobium]|uniref:hypothetical protein n=1 Tax=unclassified Rhizobium TaxID=2613769 RepID=UPI0013C4719A|nr:MULTISPECIES: hypothetical protein [unclassified Rhizobium]